MPQLTNILKDLKSEGEFHSKGRFTLDKKKAREKMKKYQLIDPHYYVLEIIQAAVASGATFIDIYLDADDCIITFDGMPYTQEDLDNIYSSLFVSQKDTSLERYRELAIGLNSAQALNPSFIKVISGDENDTTQMMITSGDETFVEPEEELKGTRIHVRERVSWQVASKFFTKYIVQQLPTEGKIIMERCQYSPIPVTVNDETVNTDFRNRLENVICSTRVTRDGIESMLGIPRAPFELSHLQFVKWGVIITTRHLRLSFIPLVGVVYGNSLIKNASQSDIVENQVYKSTLESVKKSIDEVVVSLVDTYNNMARDYDFHKRIQARDYLMEVIEAKFRAMKYNDDSPELWKKLATVKLFETTEKNYVDLDALCEQFKELKYLPFSRKYFSQPHPDGLHVIYAGEEKHVNLLGKIFSSRIKNVEKDFFRIYVREKNRDEWKLRKENQESMFLFFDPAVINEFDEDGIHAKTGLTLRNPDDYTRVVFYYQNGEIARKALKIDGLFFDAVLNNDALNPVYTFDDVKKDAEFEKTVKKLLQHAPALYLDLARKFISNDEVVKENPYVVRAHLLKYMSYALGSDREAEEQKKNKTGGALGKKPPAEVERHCEIYELGANAANPVKSKKSELINLITPRPVLTKIWKELPVFRNIRGKPVSLAMLEKDMKNYVSISFVTKQMPGPQLDDRNILIATEMDLQVLGKYFGWSSLVNYEKALKDEQNASVHLEKPKMEPVLGEDFLIKETVNLQGVTGEIGLKDIDMRRPYWTAGSAGAPETRLVEVKVLKRKRAVAKKMIKTPVSGIGAVINSDWVNVNRSWSDVVEDELWDRVKEVIFESICKMAEKCIDSFGKLDSKKDRVMYFLKEFASYYLGRLDYYNEKTKGTHLYDKLMNVPLFLTHRDRYASLEEIRQIAEEAGSIPVVNRGFNVNVEYEGLILSVDKIDLNTLMIIFGYDHVENVEAKLKELKVSETIKKTRTREKPEVNPDAVLYSIKVENEKFQFEMGLLRKDYSPGQNLSSVRFLKEEIPITTRLVPLGAQVEAAVNCNDLQTNSKWSRVIEDEKYKHLLTVLGNNVKALIQECLDRLDDFNAEDQEQIRRHILAYTTGLFRSYHDIKSVPPKSFEKRLVQYPLFKILGGKDLSLQDLANIYRDVGKIDYVPRWTDQEPLDDGKTVIYLDRDFHAYLKRLFFHFSDYTSHLEAEREARRNMEKPTLDSLQVKDRYIVKTKIDKGGIKGEIALPEDFEIKRGITFAKNMLPIVEKPLYDNSRVFGRLNSDDFNANDIFTDVELYTKEKRVILEGVYDLYNRLAGKMQKELKTASADELEVYRRYLLLFYLQQKHVLSSEYVVMEGNLEERISSLPLIPIYDGRYVSINVVHEEMGRLGSIPYIMKDEDVEVNYEDIVLLFRPKGFYQQFCTRLVGFDHLVHFKQFVKRRKIQEEYKRMQQAKEEETRRREEMVRKMEEKKAQRKARRRAEMQKRDTLDSPVDAAAIPVAAAVPEEEKKLGPVPKRPSDKPLLDSSLSPEQKLLFAVKREFRIIRERGDYKLSEKILKNMRISSFEETKAVLFNKASQILLINSSHRLNKELMGVLEERPQLIYYLLSVIYSTINRELREITDEDEMKFQSVMLENLLEHPGYAEKAKK